MCVAYEGIVLFGVVFFFGYAFSALAQFKGHPGPVRTAFQAFLYLVLGLYFAWSWAHGRRTLPMKTMGVRLIDAAGRPLGWPRAILRYVIASLGWVLPLAMAARWHPAFVLLILVPFTWALFDRRRRTLYDLLAGTRLVRDR